VLVIVYPARRNPYDNKTLRFAGPRPHQMTGLIGGA